METGNPFSEGDPRHASWARATAEAQTALARFDAKLDLSDTDREAYATRLVDLAVFRFDTWAHRCRCVVVDGISLRDYETWLDDYVRNWQVYVADTCPHVDVAHELHRRLTGRAEFWAAQAKAGAQSPEPSA